jgi:hypothetical protein
MCAVVGVIAREDVARALTAIKTTAGKVADPGVDETSHLRSDTRADIGAAPVTQTGERFRRGARYCGLLGHVGVIACARDGITDGGGANAVRNQTTLSKPRSRTAGNASLKPG